MGHYLKTELYELIKKEERIFDFILEGSLDGLWYWDLENPEEEWMNARFWELLGYDPEEMPHKSSAWQSIINPEDLKLALDNFHKHAEDPNHPYDQEVRYTHKNGSIVWVRCQGLIIRDKDGRPFRMVGTHQDITSLKETQKELEEQSKAEEKIDESERKFRELYEQSPVAIQYYNSNGDLIDVNKETLRLYGIDDVKEIAPYNFWDSNKLSDDEVIRLKNGNTVFKEDILDFDKIKELGFFDTEKSGILYVELLVSPVLSKNNTIAYLVHMLDVTERVIAEQTIKEQNSELHTAILREEEIIDRFDKAMEATSDGLFDWNLKTNKVYYSPRWKRMLGYDENELSSELSVWESHTAPDGVRIAKKELDKLFSGEIDKYNVEFKMRRKDGNWIDINSRATLFRDQKGNPARIVGTHVDITERKKVENRTRESEEKLRLPIDNSPLGVATVNMNGNFVTANKTFEDITGYSLSELNNMSLFELTHPEDRDNNSSLFNELINKQRSSFTLEKRYLHKDGSIIHVRVHTGIVHDKSDKPKFALAFIEDISMQKEAEDELLKAKEKAEEANELKTEFLHNMSHEIRTPMNGIIGFAGLLSEHKDCSDELRNYTSIIKNSSTQLLRIIDDILEISTLETKQLTVQENEFNVNQFIMELFAIYDIKSKDRNLPLYVKKALANSHCSIITDRVKLGKIMSNLLDNAFKFTSSGKIEFGYSVKESKLIFFVSDTGIGISTDKLEKIFKRFSQESTSTAQEFGGLGLGLSIAKENSELLGGSIRVESEKGIGTTFFVEIPYNTNEDNELSNQMFNSEDEQANNLFHVLIAEDEEVNFLYLEVVLDSIPGYDVRLYHAKNGKEAVEICSSQSNIDLVLMDIKMPVMNGYEATKIIKKQNPDLPIIAQTAYSTSSERELALSHGCDDFISKPVDKNELTEMVGNYLNIE